MRLRDMKYIGFKYQRENKQNSDKRKYIIQCARRASGKKSEPGKLIVRRLKSQINLLKYINQSFGKG